MAATVTAFFEDRIIARGAPADVTRAVEERWPDAQGDIHVFDDENGRAVDLDLWDAAASANATAQRGRGRPKLGVVSREVTLLPRHWEWLGGQPGGASAALRRLVDAARKAEPGPAARRESVHRFLTAMGGDRPGYEEALRALYRGEMDRFHAFIAEWPVDVRRYAVALLG